MARGHDGEMAARHPLRWGSSLERRLLGLALIAGGAMAIAGSNTVALWLLGLGTAAHAAGWAILPGAGWRRVVAALASSPAVWLLLAGPRFSVVVIAPYLCWMLVRERSVLAGLTAAIPFGTALVAGGGLGTRLLPYDRMPVVLAAVSASLVVAAVAAWRIDVALARARRRRRERGGAAGTGGADAVVR